MTQVEAGIIYAPEPLLPKPLSKKECAIARRILEHGWDFVSMQLLGGEPRISDSEEDKAAARQYRQYKRAFNKLQCWLDYWEGK